MAPFVESVHNVSGKTVHIDIDELSLDIGNRMSARIGRPLPTHAYMKIYKIDEEDQGYLLKYADPNIKINDPRGKKNGVADSAIYCRSDINIRFTVLEDELYIECDGEFLGIYSLREYPLFYKSVFAIHIFPQGGIRIRGGRNAEGDGDVKEEEDASPSTKGSVA